jgi:hypothetical protein
VWEHLVGNVVAPDADFSDAWSRAVQTILRDGPLARRIVRAVCGEKPDVAARLSLDRDRLHDVYSRLCDCLQEAVARRRGSGGAGYAGGPRGIAPYRSRSAAKERPASIAMSRKVERAC